MAIRVKGKVKRLYPDARGCYVRLDYSGTKPKSGYFRLDLNHPNYNSLYSLAVASAINDYILSIRTRNQITPSQYGDVVYMVVDW